MALRRSLKIPTAIRSYYWRLRRRFVGSSSSTALVLPPDISPFARSHTENNAKTFPIQSMLLLLPSKSGGCPHEHFASAGTTNRHRTASRRFLCISPGHYRESNSGYARPYLHHPQP